MGEKNSIGIQSNVVGGRPSRWAQRAGGRYRGGSRLVGAGPMEQYYLLTPTFKLAHH